MLVALVTTFICSVLVKVFVIDDEVFMSFVGLD